MILGNNFLWAKIDHACLVCKGRECAHGPTMVGFFGPKAEPWQHQVPTRIFAGHQQPFPIQSSLATSNRVLHSNGVRFLRDVSNNFLSPRIRLEAHVDQVNHLLRGEV